MNTHILICSQDPLVRQLLAETLREHGFHVTLAHEGVEAMNQLDLMPVELVVLDLAQSSTEAWDLVEWLLAHQPLTPIVFLTSDETGAEWGPVTSAGERLDRPQSAAQVPSFRLLTATRRLLNETPSQRLNRNDHQRLAVRHSRPFVGSVAPFPGNCGWGINE
jgi:CheY-like chemotaxis protein